MSNPRFITITGMIFIAAMSRLIPHPWNVTPVAAMALFGGAHFSDKKIAFLVPLAAMTLSNFVLGWHPILFFVYAGFALTVVIGRALRHRVTVRNVASATLASSVLFFLLTNFGHWILTDMFPRSFAGLMACYAAAIPWFRNSLAGDAFYVALVFGSFAWAERRFPALREAAVR